MKKDYLSELPFGATVKDKISGFTGVVAGKAMHRFGCGQVVVTPKALTADGDIIKACWFDAGRLEVIADEPIIECSPSPMDVTKLGSIFQNSETGCGGECITIASYMWGSNNLTLRSKTDRDKDGQPVEYVFDEGACTLVEWKEVVSTAPAVRSGGPQVKPSREKTRTAL